MDNSLEFLNKHVRSFFEKCILYLSSLCFLVRGKDGGDTHFSYEFNVALCDVTVNNVALSFSLVGHP